MGRLSWLMGCVVCLLNVAAAPIKSADASPAAADPSAMKQLEAMRKAALESGCDLDQRRAVAAAFEAGKEKLAAIEQKQRLGGLDAPQAAAASRDVHEQFILRLQETLDSRQIERFKRALAASAPPPKLVAKPPEMRVKASQLKAISESLGAVRLSPEQRSKAQATMAAFQKQFDEAQARYRAGKLSPSAWQDQSAALCRKLFSDCSDLLDPQQKQTYMMLLMGAFVAPRLRESLDGVGLTPEQTTRMDAALARFTEKYDAARKDFIAGKMADGEFRTAAVSLLRELVVDWQKELTPPQREKWNPGVGG